MSLQPTYDDVNLILRLYELRREERLRQARKWFAGNYHATSPEEHLKTCPPGSENETSFRMVVTHWEMVASFITSGVLNQDLFFQSGTELLFVWERIKDLVPGNRELRKNPRLFANLEEVSLRFRAYLDRQGTGAAETFEKFVRSVGKA